jgi:hypothetical protein
MEPTAASGFIAARSDVEYRLTNIRRAEPPADLFQVPGRLHDSRQRWTGAGPDDLSTGSVAREAAKVGATAPKAGSRA